VEEMTQTAIDTFDPAEARALFEATAQRYLHISGDEFLQRWDSGLYRNEIAESQAMRVAMLIPMIRTTSARAKSH
jgi:hypothetical protein